MRYFKVKIGYDINDFFQIDESELPKAILAQVKGMVAIFKTQGTVAGNSIISIQPDWNRELGYNRDYKMNGEDFRRLSNTTKQKYDSILQLVNENILREMKGLPLLKNENELLLSSESKQLSDKLKINFIKGYEL